MGLVIDSCTSRASSLLVADPRVAPAVAFVEREAFQNSTFAPVSSEALNTSIIYMDSYIDFYRCFA